LSEPPLSAPPLSAPTPTGRTLIAGGLVFDGTGSAAAPAEVVIEAGRIVAVGQGLDGDHRIDASGMTVMPGLIDCHVHVLFSEVDSWKTRMTPFSLAFYEAARNLRLTLEAGVTTVRDALGADHGTKAAQELGLISGPRLLIAIQMLGQTGGHGDCFLPSGHDSPLRTPYPGFPDGVVDGVVQARRAVRELARSRADWIKIAATGGVLSDAPLDRRQLRDDELAEIVTEAAAAGLDVMAHAMTPAGIKAAIRNGVRSIEHGIHLDDEAIELLVNHGVWLVPTLVAPLAVLRAADAGNVALPRGALEKARAAATTHADSFRRAVEAGVRIAMGTDSGVAVHGRNPEELAAMVDAGMTPSAALHAATGSAAELLRLDGDIGLVREGNVADLILLADAATPASGTDTAGATDVTDFAARVATVIQAGQVVHRRSVSR